MARSWPFVLALAAMSAGCVLSPKYERPMAPMPAGWHDDTLHIGLMPSDEGGGKVDGTTLSTSLASSASSVIDGHWQDYIRDPYLAALVSTALENNRNLRQAVLNIEAARAQYRIERSARLPHVDVNAGGNRQRLPASLYPGNAGMSNTYQVDLGLAAFELDLFGRVKSLSAAALDEYLATSAAAQTVRIGLIAEVSGAYIRLLAAHEAAGIAKRVASNRADMYELATLRLDGGTIAQSEYDEVKAQLYGARVEIERASRASGQARHALALLLGTRLPDDINMRDGVSTVIFEAVPPGLSSSLIERRPDIMAAEHRLRARNADIGAARAAFFPRVALTGAVGVASADFSDLFIGGSRMWRFAPQISLPIFSGGANRANLDLAHVRKDIAIAAYEQAIQMAFAEVADALTNNATLTQEQQDLSVLVDSTLAAAVSSQRRYEAGIEHYNAYLDVQRRALEGQLALAGARRDMALARIDLYRALGGSWREAREPAAETTLSANSSS